MRALVWLTPCAAAFAIIGCAEMPPRPPLSGQTELVSASDVREIRAAAKAALVKTGSASEAVYSIEIDRADYAYAWFGKRRIHYDDTEQAIVVQKVKGHWRVPPELRVIVSGSNIPTG
jgi:hypothetical protein